MIFVHHEEKIPFTHDMGALSRTPRHAMHPFAVSIQTTNSQLKIACFTYFPTFYHVTVLVVLVVVIVQLLQQCQICSEHRHFELCIQKLHENMCHLLLEFSLLIFVLSEQFF